MAKYIIDIDALLDCVELLNVGKVNGEDWCYLRNVKYLIHKFPKTPVYENTNIVLESDYEEVAEE